MSTSTYYHTNITIYKNSLELSCLFAIAVKIAFLKACCHKCSIRCFFFHLTTIDFSLNVSEL